MEGIQTFKGSWPWPWIRPYGIPSCITHRPLPIHQISLKSKKLFVDGRTYGRTDISPPSNIIRSTFRSRPKKTVDTQHLHQQGSKGWRERDIQCALISLDLEWWHHDWSIYGRGICLLWSWRRIGSSAMLRLLK